MDYEFYLHEQRNLLSSMMYITEEQLELCKDIPCSESIAHLVEQQQLIINQLLDMQYAQQTVGSQLSRANQYATVRLDAQLKNKADQLSKRLNTRIICHMKSVVLCTDVEKLLTVIDNLVTNAVKYSNKQPVMITAEKLDKRHVEIRVIDRGIGIKAADLPKIGDPLFRTKEARDMTYGTGLGIYFSKKILEQLGFELSYTSSEAGTCATITI